MWGRGVLPAALPAPFSATLSPALSVYLYECGAAGSASGQTACPFRPTLRQSGSRHSHASPLRPGCPSPPLLPVWMNVYFLFPWCWSSCRSIFCQFWLCEEAQCVYLRRHLGSPISIHSSSQFKGHSCRRNIPWYLGLIAPFISLHCCPDHILL